MSAIGGKADIGVQVVAAEKDIRIYRADRF